MIASIYLSFIFSIIGGAAWKYGKRNDSVWHMGVGGGLIAFSWMVSDPWLAFGIGTILILLLFKRQD